MAKRAEWDEPDQWSTPRGPDRTAGSQSQTEGGCNYCGGFGAIYKPVPGCPSLRRQYPCEHCQ